MKKTTLAPKAKHLKLAKEAIRMLGANRLDEVVGGTDVGTCDAGGTCGPAVHHHNPI